MLIEDNRYALSVPWRYQTLAQSVVENLQGFRGLNIQSVEGGEASLLGGMSELHTSGLRSDCCLTKVYGASVQRRTSLRLLSSTRSPMSVEFGILGPLRLMAGVTDLDIGGDSRLWIDESGMIVRPHEPAVPPPVLPLAGGAL